MDAVPSWTQVKLDQSSFARLVRLVDESCGIKLSDMKRTMLETRLRRRLLLNELDSFADYLDFLSTPDGLKTELQGFVDSVVTNETSFFREMPHFAHLAPAELARLADQACDRKLKMWSAAASSGEEAYTLAMIANEASTGGAYFPWSVLATDISVKMLKAARDAVYSLDDIASVPEPFRRKYFLKSRDAGARTVRVSPDLRRHVRFGQINLMHDEYMLKLVMDVIFCRNVLIYFDPAMQTRVVRKLCRHVRPGGLLVLGHSDTLRVKDLPLRLIRYNIYERLPG